VPPTRCRGPISRSVSAPFARRWPHSSRKSTSEYNHAEHLEHVAAQSAEHRLNLVSVWNRLGLLSYAAVPPSAPTRLTCRSGAARGRPTPTFGANILARPGLSEPQSARRLAAAARALQFHADAGLVRLCPGLRELLVKLCGVGEACSVGVFGDHVVDGGEGALELDRAGGWSLAAISGRRSLA
jgi:hypothetical protein